MAYGGNVYKTLITVEAKTKEVDNASSGFVCTAGKKRTAVSDVGSSNRSISTRKTSITSCSTHMNKGIGSQTFKTETYTYTGTEICIACLQKKDIKKKATHFCKKCDTRGRYICHSCMLDHNLWTGKDHEVVSLSVNKETARDWQQLEVQRDENDYPYIDSWFQLSSFPDDCEYGELNEQDMMTTIGAIRRENESDYHLANSDLDEMQRPGMPLPDDYPELHQHSNERTYEENTLAKTYSDVPCPPLPRRPRSSPGYFRRLNQHSDNDDFPYSEWQREDGQIETQQVETENPHSERRSFIVDGFTRPYIKHENMYSDLTYAEYVNVTKDNTTNTKEKRCMIM